MLSEDWGQNTEIGTREEGKELNGFVDEFYVYTKALNQLELDNLVKSCSMGNLDVFITLLLILLYLLYCCIGVCYFHLSIEIVSFVKVTF